MKPAAERFKVGDIVRYASGVSALFRYEGPVNVGRLYGTHVMGGAIGASDQLFFELRPASAEDIEFCKGKRPDWFAADETRQLPTETVSHAALYVSEYTGRFLSEDMQRHLLGDSAFVGPGDFGPLGTLTADIYRLIEEARAAGDEKSETLLVYVHERVCRARHDISGDKPRELPARPAFEQLNTLQLPEER